MSVLYRVNKEKKRSFYCEFLLQWRLVRRCRDCLKVFIRVDKGVRGETQRTFSD